MTRIANPPFQIDPIFVLIGRPRGLSRLNNWIGNKLLKWAARAFRAEWTFTSGDDSTIQATWDIGLNTDWHGQSANEYVSALRPPKNRLVIVVEGGDMCPDIDIIIKNEEKAAQ